MIKNRLVADLVKFGNFDLKSLADTYVWVQTTMPGDEMMYDCFYNLVALLESLMDSDTDLDVFLKTGADSSKSLLPSSSFNSVLRRVSFQTRQRAQLEFMVVLWIVCLEL